MPNRTRLLPYEALAGSIAGFSAEGPLCADFRIFLTVSGTIRRWAVILCGVARIARMQNSRPRLREAGGAFFVLLRPPIAPVVNRAGESCRADDNYVVSLSLCWSI